MYLLGKCFVSDLGPPIARGPSFMIFHLFCKEIFCSVVGVLSSSPSVVKLRDAGRQDF